MGIRRENRPRKDSSEQEIHGYFNTSPLRDVASNPAVDLTPRELETVMLLWPVLPVDDDEKPVSINFRFLGNYLNVLPGTAEQIVHKLVEKGVIRRSQSEDDRFYRGRSKISLSSNYEAIINGKIVKPRKMYMMDILGVGQYEEGLITIDNEGEIQYSLPAQTTDDVMPPRIVALPSVTFLIEPVPELVDALPLMPLPPSEDSVGAPVQLPTLTGPMAELLLERFKADSQADSPVEPISLSRQQALLAMLLWPLAKEETGRVNWAFLIGKMETTKSSLGVLMSSLTKLGIFTNQIHGCYKQNKSVFRLNSKYKPIVTLDHITLEHGQIYDLAALDLITYDEILKPVIKPPKPLKLPEPPNVVVSPDKARLVARLESLLAAINIEHQELLVAKQKADTALANNEQQRDDLRFVLEEIKKL